MKFKKLTINFPYDEMLNEARSLAHKFVPHREGDYMHSGWESLCIRGISPTHTEWHGAYGYKKADDVPYVWTDIAPITQTWFENHWPIPTKKFYRIRFMKLKAGGYVDWHSDKPTTGYLGPVNMALNNPPGCLFSFEGGETVPFMDGTAFQLDIGYKHMVANISGTDRYHIIVHFVPL